MSASSAAPPPGSFLARLAQSELPRRVLGAMGSVFVPGAGHIILGYSRIGWIVAAVLLAVGAATVLCAMSAITTGFLIFGAIYILCTVACVVSIFALPPGPRLKQGLAVLWPAFVLLIVFRVAAYMVQNYALSAVKMPSLAMAPAIGTGDIVFVSTHADVVRVGDVVLLETKDKRAQSGAWSPLGGQRVHLRSDDGKLFIDGQRAGRHGGRRAHRTRYRRRSHARPRSAPPTLAETNGAVRYASCRRRRAPPTPQFRIARSASDEVFALGDDRNDGHDSRDFGLVPRSAIRGTALFVFMSGPSLAGPGRIWKPLSAAR